MLQVTIPKTEHYDPVTNEFSYTPEATLSLEHSLISISKWESRWNKPFLTNAKKTPAETIDYIRCMTLTQNVDPGVYLVIPDSVFNQINEYITAPMTATTIHRKPGSNSKSQVVTSELIYYWMTVFNIPIECQKWHLNRLLTLISICNIKNNPGKKMSRRDTMVQNKELNEARRKALNTRG